MEEEIGKISHYYSKIGVGIIELLNGGLKVGDKIHVKGKATDFEQVVESMEIEHEPVSKAKRGDIVGTKIGEKARDGDKVYKIS